MFISEDLAFQSELLFQGGDRLGDLARAPQFLGLLGQLLGLLELLSLFRGEGRFRLVGAPHSRKEGTGSQGVPQHPSDQNDKRGQDPQRHGIFLSRDT
jgi:hypothetical protein